MAVLTRDGRLDRLLPMVPLLDTSDTALLDDVPALAGAAVIGFETGFGG